MFRPNVMSATMTMSYIARRSAASAARSIAAMSRRPQQHHQRRRAMQTATAAMASSSSWSSSWHLPNGNSWRNGEILKSTTPTSSSSPRSAFRSRRRYYATATTTTATSPWTNNGNVIASCTAKRPVVPPSWSFWRRPLSTQQQQQDQDDAAAASGSNCPYGSFEILFASQGGTAQIFAMQLAETLEEAQPQASVNFRAWNDDEPQSLVTPDDANNTLYVFITSTAGVGEPPDNGRAFYEWLTQQTSLPSQDTKFCVFGLGNSQAHAAHYNAIGKALHAKLVELGGTPIMPLGLGDDGDCIEDDFERWQEEFLNVIVSSTATGAAGDAADGASSEEEKEASVVAASDTTATSQEEEDDDEDDTSDNIPAAAAAAAAKAAASAATQAVMISCSAARDRESLERRAPSSSNRLGLLELVSQPDETVVRTHLFTSPCGRSGPFYEPAAARMKVRSNMPLNKDAVAAGLHELQIELPTPNDDNNDNDTTPRYEAGDHLIIYPRNTDVVVESYLRVLDVQPHALIQGTREDANGGNNSNKTYPHPVGLTVFETLSHCVDLGAVPSPSFSRFLLGRSKLDYKQEVAYPRRTVLDLFYQGQQEQQQSGGNNTAVMSLEDLLYNLPPMQPRYYSIASSSKVHPDVIYLTYRPVAYLTNRGSFRQGTCTTYMSQSAAGSNIVAAVKSNPTFRLPSDPATPVVMMAGGCGVAPIRSFLEERIHYRVNDDTNENSKNVEYGPATLFLGFRNPADEAYGDLVRRAMDVGAISAAHVTYSTGCPKGSKQCGNVSDAVRTEGEAYYEFLKQSDDAVAAGTGEGGYTYLCGGARTFGVAIENQIHDILKEYGNMTDEQATEYLRKMARDGRLCEDLAD